MFNKPIDVLLINPPAGEAGFRHSTWRYVLSSNIAYGILSLASYLAKHDINVRILDAAALFHTNGETVEIIKSMKPSVIGFSATTSSVNNAADICTRVKDDLPGVVSVIGGPHISSLPKRAFDKFRCFDYAVLGEGEITFLELLVQLQSGHVRPGTIKGLLYREGNKIIDTEPRPLIENLSEELPLPRWDLVPDFPKAYKAPIFFIPSPKMATLVTSRGCPYRCNFCDKTVFGNRFRSFNAEYIIESVERLVKDYGIDYLIFYDDNFTVDKQRLARLCELFEQRRLNIRWSCDAHIETLNRDLLSQMAKAGCWSIAFGLESGSPRVLHSLGKNEDIEKARNVVNMTFDAGIRTKGLFMFGSPEETMETIEETIQFIAGLKLSTMNLSKFTPYPGTPYYQQISRDFDTKLWPRLNGTTFTDINHNIPAQELERQYQRVLRSFYNQRRVFMDHLSCIFGSWDNTVRLAKAFTATLLDKIAY